MTSAMVMSMLDQHSFVFHKNIYRKIYNIRRTKSQDLNTFRLVLHLSLPNLLNPGVK